MDYVMAGKGIQRRLDSESTFYKIWRIPPGAGFFSNFLHVIGHLLIAEEKGYVPVVDMQFNKTFYNEAEPVNGTENAWEYYFEQPMGIGLEDIMGYKNIIPCSGEYNYYISPQVLASEDEVLVKRVNYLINKYIKIKDEILAEVENYIKSNFSGKKILGVHARGTDMRSGYYQYHTVSASPKDIALRAALLFDKYGFDKVFLSTEDEEYLSLFKEEFKDKVIFRDCFRLNKSGWLYTGNRQQHNYLLGREVLIDTLLLSNCNALLCGISSVSNCAIYFCNNQYDFVELITDKEK